MLYIHVYWIILYINSLTRLLMRASSSFWASLTASSVPTTVISSWSLSSAVGKMILAPVLSRTFRMFPPPLPIRNLWYSGLAFSSAVWLLVCCREKHKQVRHKQVETHKVYMTNRPDSRLKIPLTSTSGPVPPRTTAIDCRASVLHRCNALRQNWLPVQRVADRKS